MSEASVVVTLDIGGSAAKATAYDIGERAILASTSTPYPPAPASLDPGLFEPDAWWTTALSSLGSLADAVALSGRRRYRKHNTRVLGPAGLRRRAVQQTAAADHNRCGGSESVVPGTCKAVRHGF